MKNKKGIIALLSIVLLLVILFIIYKNRENMALQKPLQPKFEIPTTYAIGAWSNQNLYKIESFNVSVLESNLSEFNWESRISYTVKGKLRYRGYFKPFIKEVHICERLLGTKYDDTIEYFNLFLDSGDSNSSVQAEILITPIVDIKHNKNIKEGTFDFEFTNEHIIHSYKLWHNKIRFVCGPFVKNIEFNQVP